MSSCSIRVYLSLNIYFYFNCSTITIYLIFLNKKHASTRRRLGKSVEVVDRSMMNSQERAVSDSIGRSSDETEKAFNDETDLKNEDFIFVY